MNNTFSVLFWFLSNRISKKTGEAPIMARITVNGKRAEISTGKKVMPEKWNVSAGRVRGTGEQARIINRHLDKMRVIGSHPVVLISIAYNFGIQGIHKNVLDFSFHTFRYAL